MEWPEDLVPILRYLPGETASAWVKLAPVVPASAYLIGGTALTVHLRHRVSRDLDFALAQHEDIPAARERIEVVGLLAVIEQDEGTLNALFERTRIQFLDTSTQQLLVEPTLIAGIKVAGVEDIAAMKMKVILDRGAMRDYFDLMELDHRRVIPAEDALRLMLERYQPQSPDETLMAVVRSLGYLDDVEPDPALPISGEEIARYWSKRQPQVVRNLARW